MPVTETAVAPTKATYPHLADIPDFNVRQPLRLLNDQVRTLQDELRAARATIASLVSFVNTLESRLTTAQRSADEALAIRQEP